MYVGSPAHIPRYTYVNSSVACERARARASGIKSRRRLVYRVFNEHSRQYGEIIITSRRGKGKGGKVSGITQSGSKASIQLSDLFLRKVKRVHRYMEKKLCIHNICLCVVYAFVRWRTMAILSKLSRYLNRGNNVRSRAQKNTSQGNAYTLDNVTYFAYHTGSCVTWQLIVWIKWLMTSWRTSFVSRSYSISTD